MDSFKEFIQSNPYKTGLIGSFLFFYFTKKFYFDGTRCYSKTRLDGKTAIVTGSNTGLGKETALDFAKRGARVILACRDEKRAKKACEDIIKLSGNKNVVVELVDLSSFDSIRDFAKRINDREERLDILVNNAAIVACPRWKSKDGYEMQLAVNHLAPFLLVNLLLDKLKKSAPSRIVNVNSRAYTSGCKEGSLDIDDLNMEKSYNPWTSYQRSKMCNVFFTRLLAKRLIGTKVTVNALHPGCILTDAGKYLMEAYNLPGFFYYIVYALSFPITLWTFKSVNQGAQTQIHCSVSEDLEGVSGLYFADCNPTEYMQQILDDELAEKIWKLSEEFTKCKY